MTQGVEFHAASGTNTKGALALPEGDGRAPAVVLLQEWWGVNAHIQSLVDRLAAEGFVVLAPDLYHGKTTKDPQEAGRLMGALDWGRALDEIAGAVKFLRAHPRSNGNVGVTGFCMGGALTFATAATVQGVAAAVSFYGIPDASKVDFAKITAPMQAHFASRDGWAKPASAEAAQEVIVRGGGSLELHVYEADHAFVNDTRPEVHHPENARLAWSRMAAFFKKQLG